MGDVASSLDNKPWIEIGLLHLQEQLLFMLCWTTGADDLSVRSRQARFMDDMTDVFLCA